MQIETNIPNFRCLDAANRIFRSACPDGLDDWKFVLSCFDRDGPEPQVIKLNTDAESTDQIATDLGMQLFKCPITSWQQILTEPDLVSVRAAVKFIRGNTLIHCGSIARTESADSKEDNDQGGQDRTGLICGLYRVKTGWSIESAYQEMLQYGYHNILFGLDKAWHDLSVEFRQQALQQGQPPACSP